MSPFQLVSNLANLTFSNSNCLFHFSFNLMIQLFSLWWFKFHCWFLQSQLNQDCYRICHRQVFHHQFWLHQFGFRGLVMEVWGFHLGCIRLIVLCLGCLFGKILFVVFLKGISKSFNFLWTDRAEFCSARILDWMLKFLCLQELLSSLKLSNKVCYSKHSLFHKVQLYHFPILYK